MKTIDKWIIGILSAAIAVFGTIMFRTGVRVDGAQAMAAEAKLQAEQLRGDRVSIRGEDGRVRIFWRASEESDRDWARRIHELMRVGGQFPPNNYLCGDLHGCDVGDGNITLCIFILPGMSMQEAEMRLAAALAAFCTEFSCDGC